MKRMCFFCVEFGLISLRTENNCIMTRTLPKFKLFCKYLMQNLIYNQVSSQMADLTSPQSMWLKHFEIHFWEEKTKAYKTWNPTEFKSYLHSCYLWESPTIFFIFFSYLYELNNNIYRKQFQCLDIIKAILNVVTPVFCCCCGCLLYFSTMPPKKKWQITEKLGF